MFHLFSCLVMSVVFAGVLSEETCTERAGDGNIVNVKTCPQKCCGSQYSRYCCTYQGGRDPLVPVQRPGATQSPAQSTTEADCRMSGPVSIVAYTLTCPQYGCCGTYEHRYCCLGPEETSALTTAVIIGIVIGSVVLLAVIIGVIICIYCCVKASTRKPVANRQMGMMQHQGYTNSAYPRQVHGGYPVQPQYQHGGKPTYPQNQHGGKAAHPQNQYGGQLPVEHGGYSEPYSQADPSSITIETKEAKL